MLRRTIGSLVAEPRAMEIEIERVRRENRRMLILVAAVAALTLVIAVVLGMAAADAAGRLGDTQDLALERTDDVFLVRTDGSRARNLTPSKARAYTPAPAPDEPRIALVGHRHDDAVGYDPAPGWLP